MATTQTTRSASAPARYSSAADDEGWVLFAGVMIVTIGTLNLFWGIAAIGSSFFVADARYIVESLNTWGWVQTILGAVQIGTAFLIWAGKGLGRWIGIVMASLNAIAALLAIPAYPFWSLAIFAADVLVIYALAAHGGKPVEPAL
jgi:hypothetical protein